MACSNMHPLHACACASGRPVHVHGVRTQARQHFAAGFELPRGMLAFSQPTAAGRRLAAAYAGTEAFAVYE